jgi:hypothetical protein
MAAEVAVPTVTRVPVFWSTAWIVIACLGFKTNPDRFTGLEDSELVLLAGSITQATRGAQAKRTKTRRTRDIAFPFPAKATVTAFRGGVLRSRGARAFGLRQSSMTRRYWQ